MTVPETPSPSPLSPEERDSLAEAERDATQVACQKAVDEATAERDEALALLSKAREAWAKWLLPYRRAHSHGCGKRSDGTGETCTCGLADLSKILGTGETT